MGNSEIKIGDYIEGQELWGNKEKHHTMRIIVSEIHEYGNHIVYRGKADDPWLGARGGYVSTEYGEVRVITDEEPFTRPWWLDAKLAKTEDVEVWSRDWKPGDIVTHFKGGVYKIIGVGINTENEEEMVIYKKADGTGKVWIRPKVMFDSAVDKNKYPEVLQTWRFELFKETK